MWAKLSFRLKITIIFSLSLVILTISLTTLSLMNATQRIALPMQRRIEGVSHMVVMPDSDHQLQIDDEGVTSIFTGVQCQEDTNFFTEEQLEELANLIDEGQAHEQTNLLAGEGTFIAEETGIYTVGHLLEQLGVAQNDFRQYSYWVAGAIIVLGSLGAYLVAGIIVHPIKDLSISMKGIDADKLNESLPSPKSQDEISQLTASFNGMLDKLHRSFESKQLFAQNAAHELKTPLTIIRAHMQALKMDNEPTTEDYEEVFNEVYNNTERMIGLVEGLLAMGKSPAEADMTVFQGREVFEGIFLDLNDDIHSKNLNVEVLGDVTIKGEEMLLFQAFFNLAHNAVRYNVAGGSIVVTLSEDQIIIDDTGCGIPPDSLGQLFDPFYCVDKSRSKKLGGNGLGLAITKNIFDAHDMSIDVTSEVGMGTTITIHI